MTDFVIERGIPMPTDNGRIKSGRPKIYRWEDLGPPRDEGLPSLVYDSVLVPNYEAARMGQAWARRHSRQFCYQKQRDGSGWRVWRVG